MATKQTAVSATFEKELVLEPAMGWINKNISRRTGKEYLVLSPLVDMPAGSSWFVRQCKNGSYVVKARTPMTPKSA